MNDIARTEGAKTLAFVSRVISWWHAHPVLGPIVLAVVVMMPAFVAVGSNIGFAWYPTGDVSHTELMLRSIPDHPPLVGVAARVGSIFDQGATPGPSMAYLLYPVYFVLGRGSVAVLVSTLVVHVASVAAVLVLLRRWAPTALVLAVAVVFAVTCRALAPRFFLEPWNVWVPLFAYALFLVLVWGAGTGHRSAIPWAFAVGYHCVQTHISYVPIVGAALVVLVIWSAIAFRAAWPRLVGSVAAVTVLMWLPPVIEQLQEGTGNLRRLWEHFTSPESATVGVGAALKAVVGEFNALGPFVTGPGKAPYDSPDVIGLVIYAVIVGWGAVAVRRDRRLFAFFVVVAASSLVGLVATSRVFGEFYDYVIRWMWIQAGLLVAVAAVGVGRAVVEWLVERRDDGPGLRMTRRALPFLPIGAIVLVSVVGVGASVGARPPYAPDSRIVAGLATPLDEVLDSRDDGLLLRWHDPASLGGTSFGLVLEMEKRGVEIHVEPWAGAAARRHRVITESQADAVLWLVTGPENIAAFARRSDAVKLAETDPRSADERRESDELRGRIEDMMIEAGHPEWIDLLDSQYGHMQVLLFTPISDELFAATARYSELRLPTAVFEVPVGAPYFP
jgi:hypothetical protein